MISVHTWVLRRLANQANRLVPAGAAGRPPDTGPVEREVRRHVQPDATGACAHSLG